MDYEISKPCLIVLHDIFYVMGLWLKPYVIRYTNGDYVKHMVSKQYLYGWHKLYEYGFESVIGGQGGDINAHGEMWNSSLEA